MIGGYDGKSRLKDCERINLIEGATSTYENMNSMNEARSHFGYAFHNKAIYVVGGFGQSKKIGNIPTDTVEKYEIEKDKWTLLSVKLPLKLSGVSCGYFEDDKKIKIFGGNDSINRSTRLVFELDVHSDEGKLRECNAMLKKRQMNNKLYIKDQMVFLVGGTNESDCEIWKKFYTDEETIMEKTLFSYDKVIQGDLNCFSGFIM